MKLSVIGYLLLLGVSGSVYASTLTVEAAWARATPPGAPVGAVYMDLFNPGKEAITVNQIKTSVARMAQIHSTLNVDGVMRMRSAMPLTIGASERLSLAPGGMHVMLMGLRQPLAAGATFNLDLGLANGENLRVEVLVGQAAQMSRPETIPAP